jgi:uncharacterized repeat protein (TIGR01451 family)
MNIIHVYGFIGLFLVSVLAEAADAALPSPVQLVGEVKLDKVGMVNGRQKHLLVEPRVVVPGDHLVFVTRYRNASAAPVSNFVVTNPLPGAVALTTESAAALTVSVDGGQTWGPLASLAMSDGQGGKRPALTTDVTHIRWTLPLLQPGTSGALTYHAIVR